MSTRSVKPWSYPVKGMTYLITHPSLLCHFCCALSVTLFVSLTVLVLSFVFLYPLQRTAFLHLMSTGWATFLAILLTLVESSLIILISFQIILQCFIDQLTDYVWKDKGMPSSEIGYEAILGGIKAGLLLLLIQIVLLIVTLPFNAIPIAGTFLFCLLNGIFLGWERQLRYHLEIKKWKFKESWENLKSDWHKYAEFGTIAMFLQLIPIVNFVFLFTNVLGAALWSVDDYFATLSQQQAQP